MGSIPVIPVICIEAHTLTTGRRVEPSFAATAEREPRSAATDDVVAERLAEEMFATFRYSVSASNSPPVFDDQSPDSGGEQEYRGNTGEREGVVAFALSNALSSYRRASVDSNPASGGQGIDQEQRSGSAAFGEVPSEQTSRCSTPVGFVAEQSSARHSLAGTGAQVRSSARPSRQSSARSNLAGTRSQVPPGDQPSRQASVGSNSAGILTQQVTPSKRPLPQHSSHGQAPQKRMRSTNAGAATLDAQTLFPNVDIEGSLKEAKVELLVTGERDAGERQTMAELQEENPETAELLRAQMEHIIKTNAPRRRSWMFTGSKRCGNVHICLKNGESLWKEGRDVACNRCRDACKPCFVLTGLAVDRPTIVILPLAERFRLGKPWTSLGYWRQTPR